MSTKHGDLMMAVRELDQALATTGPEQATRLAAACARVEEEVRKHTEELNSGHELIDVDRPRFPSPVVDRQVGELNHELDEMQREAVVLRSRLRNAERSPGATPPDLEKLRERARRLLAMLEHYEAEEVRVIQDNVMTDIGAGD